MSGRMLRGATVECWEAFSVRVFAQRPLDVPSSLGGAILCSEQDFSALFVGRQHGWGSYQYWPHGVSVFNYL